MNSAIYTGWIRHRRFQPRTHDFRYRMFMLLLDLDEVETLAARLVPFATRGLAPIRFDRADHHGPQQQPLAESIRELVAAELGERPHGAVRLLTQPRIWGIGFNPISLYYCYRPDGTSLQAVVAEVTNTPWKERRCYVLPAGEDGHSTDAIFAKTLHVSPFMAMDQTYRLRGKRPGARLAIHLESTEHDRKKFDATLSLKRVPMTSANLALSLLGHPFSTAKVITAIHWQALRLLAKRLRVYEHTPQPRDRSAAVRCRSDSSKTETLETLS